ncbi:MAG: hypothetical protein AAGK47_02600 [Bacteroidota bacterium]
MGTLSITYSLTKKHSLGNMIIQWHVGLFEALTIFAFFVPCGVNPLSKQLIIHGSKPHWKSENLFFAKMVSAPFIFQRVLLFHKLKIGKKTSDIIYLLARDEAIKKNGYCRWSSSHLVD